MINFLRAARPASVAGMLFSASLAQAAPPAPATTQAVFPTAVATQFTKEKPGAARMHTCLAQYTSNKATHANGGMRWIQKGGGYYSACLKQMKA